MADNPIYQNVGVADPGNPKNVLKPNPDGSINVEGDLTVSFDQTEQPLEYQNNQLLQRLLMTNIQIRNALLLLLGVLSKTHITLNDLQGVK